MKSNIFCINEEDNDKQNILGLLLSIELYDPTCTCVIFCTPKTKEFICNFPKSLSMSLNFRDIGLEGEANILRCINNIIKSITYTVETYGSCIFIQYNLIMTNKLVIPKKIIKQGFGFIKKTHTLHEKKDQFQLYSLEMIYLNNLYFIDVFKDLFNNALECEDILKETLDPDDKDKKQKVIDTFLHAAYDLVNTHNITMFLEKYTSLGTESFHGYEKNVKFENIAENLYINRYPICFFKINLTVPNEGVINLNKRLLSLLSKKNQLYMSIVNIKLSKNLLQFVIPKKIGVGIWDRSNDFPGLYEIIELITEDYNDYFNYKELNFDYFSLSNFILTDKPSHVWLNNNIIYTTKILMCNYDSSLIELLNEKNENFSVPSSFLFYYPHSLKILNEFIKEMTLITCEEKIYNFCTVYTDLKTRQFTINFDETEIKEKLDYKNLLKEISKTKYCKFNEIDVNLIATCLGLGIVPLFEGINDTNIFDLEKDKHYITSIEEMDNDQAYENKRNDCLEYFNTNINIKAYTKKLISQIFIRDI